VKKLLTIEEFKTIARLQHHARLQGFEVLAGALAYSADRAFGELIMKAANQVERKQ